LSKIIFNLARRKQCKCAMPMRVQGKLDQPGVQLAELSRAHQRSAVRIPLRAITRIGCDNENRRLGAMPLQDGLRICEVVDIAVIECQEQRALGQRIAGKEIARVNEVKARANKIAELLVELLGRDRETIGAARMNLVIAQNPQRRTPEGEMSEAGPPVRSIRGRMRGHSGLTRMIARSTQTMR
jgi:hypothetical protein